MKIAFFGNHTVGIRSLEALLAQAEVVGVVAHPLDEEDGIRYESVYDFSQKKRLPVIRGTGKNQKTFEFIKELKPDLIWITDYRYIIPENLIKIAPLGAVNIHPSLLPKYRGRAALNWAIINGEKEIGLTAHFVDNGVDTGDIIEQTRIPVSEDEDIADVLNKCYPLYYSLTRKVIMAFKEGVVNRFPQTNTFPVFPKRTAEDGKIDWNQPINKIYNLIKAVSHPYPGAFSNFQGKKIFIWKAIPEPGENFNHFMNGCIIEKDDHSFKVKCPGGLISITNYSCEDELSLNTGDCLI
jgi:Methionyl-tRNA formyltransferase